MDHPLGEEIQVWSNEDLESCMARFQGLKVLYSDYGEILKNSSS